MTQCTATAELMTSDMTVLPGVILRCELEAEHTDPWELARLCCGGLPNVHPATPHSFTFRWAEPTVDELAEVLDPDESFDLEVDIADEAVLEQQQNNAIANGEPVDERDYPRDPEL